MSPASINTYTQQASIHPIQGSSVNVFCGLIKCCNTFLFQDYIHFKPASQNDLFTLVFFYMHLGGLFHNSAIAYFAQRIDRYFGQKKGRKLQIYLRNLRGRSEDRNKKSLLQQVQLFRAAAVSEHHWT